MPIHDWTRVHDGIFHNFHLHWIAALSDALNDGRLPGNYYALAEQTAGRKIPDVLTLQSIETNGSLNGTHDNGGGAAGGVALAKPKVRHTAETEMDTYVMKQNTLVVRHVSDDRVVALLEIVSAGNKASQHNLKKFVEKATDWLYRGYHLLVIDLHPPGKLDPQGIHGAIWSDIANDSFELPEDKPLTLAAYECDCIKTAYVEPVAVGDSLPDMPLYLEPDFYVNVPLEETYQTTWRHIPRRWQRVLEPTMS